jgi:TolB-like protein/Flp pilus assembly protein TadD
MSLFEELKRRNVLRVAAAYGVVSWLVLQIADILFDFLQVPDSAGKILLVILLLGFIPVLVFSWAFELTPDGIKRESEVDHDQSITRQTGRKLEIATIVMIVIGISFALYSHYYLRAPQVAPVAPTLDTPAEVFPGISSNSIAVLPFADMSPQGDQKYFSRGIAEEILNVLVGIDGLEVASRTSSFQFEGQELGIPRIAEELMVRHVLEGSVRKAADTLRITAQLIDAENDRHVWSETYDRPLSAENVFQVQDEIASAIVSELSNYLGLGLNENIEVKAATENLDAYELYLRARQFYLARERLDEADELLAQATQLDPSYAEAWELRAPLQLLTVMYGYAEQSSISEGNELAKQYAERALALDDRRATALATLGMIERNTAWEEGIKIDYVEHLAKFDRAVAIEPRNGSALLWRGLSHAQIGNLDSALADFEACVRFEPLYSACETNRQVLLGVMGRDEEAIQLFLDSLDKGVPKVMMANLPQMARLGREDLFKVITNTSEVLAGWRRHDDLYDAFRNPDADHGELAAQMAAFLDSRGIENPNDRDMLLGPLGYGGETWNPILGWDPSMAKYRRSSNYQKQIKESGVFAYWKANDFPPQCRLVGDDGFACD